MNILICEDNAIIAMDLGGMLEDMGHEVCGMADTSVKAMQQTALKRPDLVMVDLNLADGRTGLGLVDALAELMIPSVIVSGETHSLPNHTWAQAVVAKPFTEALLKKAIAEAEAELRGRWATDPTREASHRTSGALRALGQSLWSRRDR